MKKSKTRTERHVSVAHYARCKGLNPGLAAIMEDVFAQQGQDLCYELAQLHREYRLSVSYIDEVRRAFERRRREIRKVWTERQAAYYEGLLCQAVDEVDPYLQRLRVTVKGELVQRLRYQDVEQAVLVAIMGGVLHACERIHEMIDGRRQYYSDANFYLRRFEDRHPCTLLNGDKQPVYTESMPAMEDFIQKTCAAIVKVFSSKKMIED